MTGLVDSAYLGRAENMHQYEGSWKVEWETPVNDFQPRP